MDILKALTDLTNVSLAAHGNEPVEHPAERFEYETPEEYRRQDAEKNVISPTQPMRGGEL